MQRVVIASLVACALASAASAATFTVTSTLDAVDAAIGDGTCATAGGVCSLRAAVQEANASAAPDDVVVPGGTFVLSLAGAAEDAAATGDLDVSQPLTITGAGMDATAIDGGGADRVFHVQPNTAFTLRAVTVRNGVETTGAGGVSGEVMAPITIEDVRFRLNRGATGGGLLGVATLVVRRSLFEQNIASDVGGGLLHGAGGASLELGDSVFDANVATNTGGGFVYGGTGTAVVDGVVVRNNVGGTGGGGVVASAASLQLTDAVFEDNTALGMTGGGGFIGSSLGTATLDAVTLRRNTSAGSSGGMILVATVLTDIRNSTIEENTATEGGGGMTLVAGGGSVTIEDTAIRRNRALGGNAGGLSLTVGAGALTVRGLLVDDNGTLQNVGGMLATVVGGDVVIERSRFAGNAAAMVAGGLYVTGNGSASVRDTVVQGNQAFGQAGGMFLGMSGASTMVDRSTFADNLVFGAGVGGGLMLSAAAPATITNSTFSGNWAQTVGAGLFTSVATTVASSTFFGNVGGMPGGAVVVGGGSITMRATVIGAGPSPSCAAALTSAGDNVDQDGSCGLAGPGDRSGIDPQLGPLQDNGGPTWTHEPLPASPLIDGAGGAVCPDTDQRGVARPTDGNGDGTAVCDVGAVEFVDECPTDPDKRLPGVCGCGVPDVDTNDNGAVDCLLNAELKARIATSRTVMQSLTGDKTPEQTAARAALTTLADGLLAYVTEHDAAIAKTDPSAKLVKLAKKARKLLRATRKGKGGALAKKQTRAGKALDALDAAVAPQA